MAIYARLENGTYAEVTGVYKTDGTEITEIFQGDRLVYSATNEIYGTVPLYYDGLGYELIDYLISGNTVQDGTPSPDAPVEVQGFGVRTGNLFDIKDGTQTISNVVWTAYHGTITAHGTTTAVSQVDTVIVYNGTFTRSGNYINYCKIQASKSIKPPAGIYTFSANANPSSDNNIALIVGDNGTYYANSTARKIAVGETFSVNGNEYVMFVVSTRISINQYVFADIMLNLGSTALPYEPYGYKLPLTVNGTEYPIYLGQVETRRVKKLVLTGKENWSGKSKFRIGLSGQIGTIAPICTHYRGATTAAYGDLANGMVTVNGGINQTLAIYDAANQSSLAAWKSYLAAQYAAGTPVTVWYVLAEPETAVVNEPLMKIGDYADTIIAAQAGVTIPTVSGANVLDMTSPVKPSEVYIKGKGIKHTGYGQLKDVNDVNILDKDSNPIYVHGQ